MEGKAKILVYGFSAEEQRRIDDGLVSLGVPPALQARPAQGGVPLRRILAGEDPTAPAGKGAAADQPAGDAAAGRAADEPSSRERLVLFHNVTDAGVRALIRFLREAVACRPIFAVTTPTSIDWTLGKLLAHLAEERAALGEGR